MDENGMQGSRFGCLEVLDNGDEYPLFIDSVIKQIENEKREFEELVEDGLLERHDWYGWKNNETVITPAYDYIPETFETYHSSVNSDVFETVINEWQKKMSVLHYKCKCRKCGKIRYYSLKTLQEEPAFCLRPIYCSSKSALTYSNRAKNATYNKIEKYKNNEAVRLVSKPEDVAPSEDYCGKWNEKQQKEIDKRIQKDTALIESLPRVYAKNFDDDYAGMTYESLDILECIDARYEAKPDPTIIHTPTQKKSWRQVVVYKRYKCRCYLCGKEQEVSCDKFGIYPPTGYGYHAYYGYWSNLSCDCHPISSFQWIVNKLLFENRVPYHVEYSFPDLYGIREQNLLRFDFAIFNEDGSLKCLIECQGEQHYKPVDEFGGINQLKSQVANDEVKRQYAKNHHIPLIEITYKEKKYEKVESILKQQGII